MNGDSTPVKLAPVTELEDYGAGIAAELAGAEAELAVPHARPFAGMSAEVMADVERLRGDQLDIFRQHISIEQQHRVPRPGADTDDVRHISFSSIAGTMRDKEIATSQLLARLDNFDQDLRKVISKFESPTGEINAEPEEGVGNAHPGNNAADLPGS
jgi:hypothetical protein